MTYVDLGCILCGGPFACC